MFFGLRKLKKRAAQSLSYVLNSWPLPWRRGQRPAKQPGGPKRGSSESRPPAAPVHIVLAGRDVPARPVRQNPPPDLRRELEVEGFLDQFPPHPLLRQAGKDKP